NYAQECAAWDLGNVPVWSEIITGRCPGTLRRGGLGRRGYYHATDARSSRWIEALQSNDKDFLPIAPKSNQLIFVRWSFESMLPLQAIRIYIRADCAEEVRHSFSFTLLHHLPCFVDNRVPACAL